MLMAWRSWSALGEMGFVLPMLLIFGLLHKLSPDDAPFAPWILRLMSGGLVVLATKVAYMGWHRGIPALHFTGISGHAYLASALLTFWLLRARPLYAMLNGLLILVSCSLVAAARVALDAHSWSEALIGEVMGIAVSLAEWQPLPAKPKPTLLWRTPPLLLVSLTMARPSAFAWLQTYPYERRFSLWLHQLLMTH